ncbi:TraB/GumN family protein [Candidatus Woesearchaeota archaeon]|nr:TraB/GumN family protein [Candidatus Woesearchaeota archaeon]
MKSFGNLIILGTSHIAIESVNKVKQLIEEETPEIIALELDILRFKKLLSNRQQNPSLKDLVSGGSVMNTLGAYIEKKLGEKVGMRPGEEMLTAIKLAKKYKLKIALIDQPIQITFKRLSKNITFKEKFRFVVDILASLISQKKRIKIDLTKVPEKNLIKRMIKEVKMRYPNVYKTLIYERNIYMAQQLTQLLQSNKKILAIVGAGHEDELLRLIKWNLQKKK